MTRPHRDERGATSIFEVIVTIALLSIVIGVVYQGIDSMSYSAAGSEDRLVNLSEARTLMDSATRDVRTAVRLQAGTAAFVIADAREVEFYANLNPGPWPRRIHIYVDGKSQLIEEVKKPDAASIPNAPNYTYDTDPNNKPVIRFVGRYVANPTSGPAVPLFRYYAKDGSELTPPPLSPDKLIGIYSVQITLMIRRATSRPVGFTTLQNQVRLPNLDFTPVIT